MSAVTFFGIHRGECRSWPPLPLGEDWGEGLRAPGELPA